MDKTHTQKYAIIFNRCNSPKKLGCSSTCKYRAFHKLYTLL